MFEVLNKCVLKTFKTIFYHQNCYRLLAELKKF